MLLFYYGLAAGLSYRVTFSIYFFNLYFSSDRLLIYNFALYWQTKEKEELAYHDLIQAMPVGQQMTITSAFYTKSKNIPVVLNNNSFGHQT